MKSLTTIAKRAKNSTTKNDDIIILSFKEDENMDDLIKEMQEEEMLAKKNEAMKMISEINMINRISFNKLSRVA